MSESEESLSYFGKNLSFLEYEITIEDENLKEEDTKNESNIDSEKDITEALKSSKLGKDTVIWEDAVTSGGEDEKADAELKQSDYEKALGNEESDPLYSKFLSRLRKGGEKQILRYYCGPRTNEEFESDENREGNIEGDNFPLPVSSTGYVNVDKIPQCEHCHSPRVFEFQIMPQLLHYLMVDQSTHINKMKYLESQNQSSSSSSYDASLGDDRDIFINKSNEDIDWGSIDVFTCSRSCAPPESTPYVKEFCWRQPPPVVSGHQLS